jgi:hypothetical protein
LGDGSVTRSSDLRILERATGGREAQQVGAGRHLSLWQFVFEFDVLFFARVRLTSTLARMSHLIVEISTSILTECLGGVIEESIWKDSCIGNLKYRVDPERPEMKQMRHVHLAHPKHIASTDKQVSWNIDGSRHDKGRFYNGFKGFKDAEAAARIALNLPENFLLEDVQKTENTSKLDEALKMILESTEVGGLLSNPEFILAQNNG